MLIRLLTLAALLLGLTTAPLRAQSDVVAATLIPGWRMADGSHMAGLRLRLEPGWKTYWRAPGDVGIPPQFDWRKSGNIKGVSVEWPSPGRYMQAGLLTIGYKDEVVLPLAIRPSQKGRAIDLRGTLTLGVCLDVCIPVTLAVNATLPPTKAKRDPRIVAALASRPHSADEARVTKATCQISPAQDGLKLTAHIRMPSAGGDEMVIGEAANPKLWIAPARTSRQGGTLTAHTTLHHVEGRPFAINRSDLRLTVLGARYAVDIQGCSAG